MTMFTHSIRWRLQLWLAFLLLCVLSGFGAAVYQLHRNNQLNQIDEELERRVSALGRAVRGGPPPFGQRPGRPPDDGLGRARGGPGHPDFDGGPGRSSPPRGGPDSMRSGPDRPGEMRFGPRGFGPREVRLTSEVAGLFDETRTNGFYFTIWSRDGTLLKRSTNAPADVLTPERLAGDTRTHTRMRDTFRESFHFTELGDCVLAGRSITADLNVMRRFAGWLLAAGGAVLLLGLGGGWYVASRAIRPVEDISATASRISAGNLSERIPVANADNELGRLAGVLNSTFSRLEAAFAQQKQFTADASHELRTPLAVLISEAQTALARERSAVEYRETVEACLDTAQQMRRLTESLLELARLDAGQEQISRYPLEVAKVARDCVERIRPLAEHCGIKIHCEFATAEAFSNADRLGQVIANLLTNAIHYNKPGGQISVNTRAENDAAVLTIADTGKGIAPEDLPHIFERFYRADKSRSRADGHFGLGLAICKAIVNADGGNIEVSSEFGVGTTFTVRLPRLPA